MKIEEKFIRYVKIDTKSDENSLSTPSTKCQLSLAKLLVEELHSLGVTNAYLDEFGLVYGQIEGDETKDPIGLIAHMDTSPDLDGGNFEPRVISSYDGKDIKLNDQYTLSPKDFPSLKEKIGHKLIVTDGNHLLGGDDKAGISIIMGIVEYYNKHPEINHAPIRICFTPDEEIGRGSENFSVKKMNAKIAYTLDGGKYNEINYENFNAYSLEVDIQGVSIHPGSAKGIMVNASLVGNEFISLLPKDKIPSKTEGYEGFNHLTDVIGNVEECKLYFIIRNHDDNLAKEQIKDFYHIKHLLQIKYPTSKIEIKVKESYKNMRSYFDKDFSAIEKITKAMKKINIDPSFVPIRGGTDGAGITFMGLPCPNIGTGSYNCHGRYEYADVDEMYLIFEIVKNLLED